MKASNPGKALAAMTLAAAIAASLVACVPTSSAVRPSARAPESVAPTVSTRVASAEPAWADSRSFALRPPISPPAPAGRLPAAEASAVETQVRTLLASAAVPPRAEAPSQSTAAVLATWGPSYSDCAPLYWMSRYFALPATTLDALEAWARQHPPAGGAYSGRDLGSDPDKHLDERGVYFHLPPDAAIDEPGPMSAGSVELTYTFVQTPGHMSARIDAVIVPKGAACMNSGGGPRHLTTASPAP